MEEQNLRGDEDFQKNDESNMGAVLTGGRSSHGTYKASQRDHYKINIYPQHLMKALYKAGCFMDTTRDSFPPESTTDVNQVQIPGFRRPPTSKYVRSHNKDEAATKSAQGHYIRRDGSSSHGKRRDSNFGPDQEYQYKYVTITKDEEDEESAHEDEDSRQPPPQIGEIQTYIKMQRHKIKFKFALDDYSLIPNCLQRLNGSLSEMVVTKMMKRILERSEPGPLMEKRVFMNEKLQYYIKRYQQIREQPDLATLQKKVNFHPEEPHLVTAEDDESISDVNQNKSDRIVGLKLKPLQERKKPPRSRALALAPQSFSTNGGRGLMRNMSNASPTKGINQTSIDESKNIIIEVPTQLQISDIPTNPIDQSQNLSTTGINVGQTAHGGESSPENFTNINANFWHSANPALVPQPIAAGGNPSPAKKGSLLQIQSYKASSSPLGKQADPFFVRRTSSRVHRQNLIKVSHTNNEAQNKSSYIDLNLTSQHQPGNSVEIKNKILAMTNNLTHATNEYIHKILQDIAQDAPKPLLGAPSSKQGQRPPSLFKSQHSGAFLSAAIQSSTAKVNSSLGNVVTKQASRQGYVKIDRNIAEKKKSVLRTSKMMSQSAQRIQHETTPGGSTPQNGQNNHMQFMKYVQQQQHLHKQQMQSNHLNWAKSFGSASGYYDKINEMITHNKMGSSSSNVIKHASSMPSSSPNTNFESNLYMINKDQYNSANNQEARNPLRSAILPTKVSLVMQPAPSVGLQKPKILSRPAGY